MNIHPSAHADLLRIGLTPDVLHQFLSLTHIANDPGAAPPHLLRVVEVHRDSLTLHNGQHPFGARALPALHARLSAQADALAVGDWVLARRNALGEWWAFERLPPSNQLARRLHDGRDKVERVVIVSNIDTALLVMGLDHDFSLSRLERYVALVCMAGVMPVVVLTKADLCRDPQERLLEVRSRLPAGADAVALNALGSEATQALAPWLAAGQTLVLLGSSGAGKSTLTNSLTQSLGTGTGTGTGSGAAQDTGPNRQGDSRGRHTTTARSLHPLPGGACVIDTPGLRTLRLDGEAQALDAVFEDIAQLAQRCRFRDCGHRDEPGCAVREAVAPARLRNFHKLLREARRDTLTALERKAQVAVWKARSRGARQRDRGA